MNPGWTSSDCVYGELFRSQWLFLEMDRKICPVMETPITRPPDPAIIYHYTSQEGLLGIFQQKVLWVSSIRHLNDAAEVGFAVELMRERLKPLPEDDLSLWNPFYDQVSTYFETVQDADSFVGSFSQENDQL